jgi:hypothetical protein
MRNHDYDLTGWKSVSKDGFPDENVEVFYYFEHTGIGSGLYERTQVDEFAPGAVFHCFVGDGGFL